MTNVTGRRARSRLADAGDSPPSRILATLRRWPCSARDGSLATSLMDASAVPSMISSPCHFARFPVGPLMRRAYEQRANVTAYDAAYVALAEGLGCPLVTGDRRLAAASGINCEIEVLATDRTRSHPIRSCERHRIGEPPRWHAATPASNTCPMTVADPADELFHPVGEHPSWSESYYFKLRRPGHRRRRVHPHGVPPERRMGGRPARRLPAWAEWRSPTAGART